MPCRDADSGMDQLMREDGRDLRRHGVRRVREVGPDEDFKMPVRAQPVIPALADRLALPARAGEADRHADTRGQGSVQRREQGGHARRHPIEPAFPVVLFHTFYSLQIALRGDGCGHRSRVRAEQPAREGGSGNLREWCGRALRANPVPLIAVAGERRPGPPFPMRTNIMPAHAGTMPEIRLRSRPRHVGRHLRPRPLAGLGSEASRATVPRSGRRSLLA